MKRLVYIIVTAFVLINGLGAQTAERKWNVGAHGGFIQYAGDRGQSFYRFNQAAYGFGGISVSRYLSNRFDLLFFSSSGEVGNRDVTKETRREAASGRNSFLARQHTVTVGVKYNFVDAENYVRPYVFLGPSVMLLEKRHTVEETKFDFLIPTAAAGINFRVNAIMAFELRETFMYLSSDDLDFTTGGLNDAFLYHTAGINFNLGRSYISPKQHRLPNRTLFKK
jgi:OmpA-OmpF porin, OOP family